MRSSKSRSRSKSNRQRSLGNIVNRVFDSSGPEGKVRGTPQQIIDKYLMLARDAQLGNDRVAEQNFLQHAEHYTRMLGEAQRELAREQELRQGQGQGAYPQGGQNGNGGSGQYRAEPRDRDDDGYAPDADMQPPALPAIAGDEDAELVETPEARRDQRRRDDRPRDDRPRDDRSRDNRFRENRPPRDQDRPAAATTAAGAAAATATNTAANTPADAPAVEETVGTVAPKADRGPKRPRQPRAPRPQGSEAVAAAEPATGTPDET